MRKKSTGREKYSGIRATPETKAKFETIRRRLEEQIQGRVYGIELIDTMVDAYERLPGPPAKIDTTGLRSTDIELLKTLARYMATTQSELHLPELLDMCRRQIQALDMAQKQNNAPKAKTK